jgi:hypothetical protein
MLSNCTVGCQAFPGIGRWRPVVIPARGMLVSIPMIQINTHHHPMFTKMESKSADTCLSPGLPQDVCYNIASLDHPPPCAKVVNACTMRSAWDCHGATAWAPAGAGHVWPCGCSQRCDLATTLERHDVSTHATAMHQIHDSWTVAHCLWQALPCYASVSHATFN